MALAPTPKVRFYARGAIRVSDYDALDQEPPLRRAIGRRYAQVPGQPGRWGWLPTGEPQEVRLRHEVARDCAEGLLWPADEETARLCSAMMFAGNETRIKFDPTFGGEVQHAPEEPPTPTTDEEPGDGQKAS